MELLEKVAQLSGGQAEHEALLSAQLEEARQDRVELLRRQITRRILNRSLSIGFTTWAEQWEATNFAHARLRVATAKLRTPQLFATFAFWRSDFEQVDSLHTPCFTTRLLLSTNLPPLHQTPSYHPTLLSPPDHASDSSPPPHHALSRRGEPPRRRNS